MAQFLYRITPTRLAMLSEGATPQEEAIVGEHFQYLQRLLAENVLILAGRTLLEVNEHLESSSSRRPANPPRGKLWKTTLRYEGV